MIDLQNDCALNAVAAATGLNYHDVKNDVLRLYGKIDGDYICHVICIFEFKNRLHGYDPSRGSTPLSKNLSFKSSPTTIAKDWAKKTHFEPRVYKGEWYE